MNLLNTVTRTEITANDQRIFDARPAITGTEGDDILIGDFGADLIDGGPGNDHIVDTHGGNTLRGGAGDDLINGVGTLVGGLGNDTLLGDGTFDFDSGDGHDTIGAIGTIEFLDDAGSHYKQHTIGQSTLRFGPGIAPASLQLVRRGSDLQFRIDANNDVTVRKWFDDSSHRLARVEFASGASWERAAIASMPVQVPGTPGDDTLHGTAGNNVMLGEEGNDLLYAPLGRNVMFGGPGDDIIMGRGSFFGGPGNDTLIGYGRSSRNVFFYARGDGRDSIQLHGDTRASAGRGTVNFLDDLSEQDLWFSRNGNDLDISVVGSSQGVDIKDWFSGPSHQVADIQVGNDKFMSGNKVDALVAAMAQFSPPTSCSAVWSPYMQLVLAPAMAAAWSNTVDG